ncbi:hypothetical protein [Noviherbaspirillum aerium]|uniref:hypothetical protein n=1 Tax=Noviherbaspirillum aerium TaxID=2588497 RepID=UPI00298FF13F|nr:hypothetical protein [Noviherbaspirillum aerium]
MSAATEPDAASAPAEQRPRQQRQKRKAGKHTESEPEFALLHEAGWQAQEPPSLLPVTEVETRTGTELAIEPESADLEQEGEGNSEPESGPEPSEPGIQEPRHWSDDTWTVRVIRNEANNGWAAEIQRNGESEPALVCPWELDRDKIHPKPLDGSAFETLIRTATDMRRRQERQLQAMLHKSVMVQTRSAVITVTLDIVPDDDDSYAVLAACDEAGEELAKVRVAAGFRLSKQVASAWVDSGYRKVDRR